MINYIVEEFLDGFLGVEFNESDWLWFSVIVVFMYSKDVVCCFVVEG